MTKVEKGIMPFLWPQPIAIVATRWEEKDYLETVAFLSGVSYKPPLLVVGSAKGHATTDAILKTKKFTVNVASKDIMKETDLVGFTSSEKKEKSKLFDIIYVREDSLPVIKESPVSYVCEFERDPVETESHYIFFGRILNTWIDEDVLTEDKYDWKIKQPLIYNSKEIKYWVPGKPVGDAYREGRDIQ